MVSNKSKHSLSTLYIQETHLLLEEKLGIMLKTISLGAYQGRKTATSVKSPRPPFPVTSLLSNNFNLHGQSLWPEHMDRKPQQLQEGYVSHY